MACNVVRGENYRLMNGIINFFGARGMRSRDGWLTNTPFSDSLMLTSRREDEIPQTIQECIVTDVKAGKGDRIACVTVGARSAVLLYLGNYITIEHLRKASEGEDYIDIPNVNFEGLSLTVHVINSSSDFFVATADKDYTVIK